MSHIDRRAQHPLGKISIPEGLIRAMEEHLRKHPELLLEIPAFRSTLAKVRYGALKNQSAVTVHEGEGDHVRGNAIAYNAKQLDHLVGFDRPAVLVHPLRSLTLLADKRNKDVLSIGPRTEIEIFSLLAAGFTLDRIRAVDLFTYSPLIEPGDMHDLDFPAGSFHVTLAGWVLAYSADPAAAVAELVRVTRHGGVVAIGCDFHPGDGGTEYCPNPRANVQGPAPRFVSCDDILALFPEGSVHKVLFRADATPPYTEALCRNILVVQIQKPDGGAADAPEVEVAPAAPPTPRHPVDALGPIVVAEAAHAPAVRQACASAGGNWRVEVREALPSTPVALVVGAADHALVSHAAAAGVPTVTPDAEPLTRRLRELAIEQAALGMLAPLRKNAPIWNLLSQMAEQRMRFLATRDSPGSHRQLRPLYVQAQGIVNDTYRLATGKAFPPREPLPVTGALGTVDAATLAPVLTALERDGFARWPSTLDPAVVERLVEFGRTAPVQRRLGLHQHEDLDRYPGPDADAKRYDFRQQVLLDNPDIRDLVFDPSLRALVSAALKMEPVQDMFTMWWSTPHTDGDGEANARSQAAQLYHYDMDRLAFLKVFFYLTDVTPETGPHCMIRGSHRSKPGPLWKDSRHADATVHAHYGPADRMELTGPKGSILIVDTRAFHKGKPLVSGERLVFQLEFASDLFGCPYDTLTLPPDAAEAHKALVRERRRTYERFTLDGDAG